MFYVNQSILSQGEYFVYLLFIVMTLVLITSAAIDCLERLVTEMM